MAAFTLLQETHTSAADATLLRRRYRATWGFNRFAPPMSYWSRHEGNQGGVAILLNPYEIQQSAPVLRERWNQHFMAIKCILDGREVTVINIYAPSAADERERFFREMATCPRDFTGPVIVGGDFNCTQNPEFDRSYARTAARHVSAALAEWLRAWELIDALAPFFPTEEDDNDVYDLFWRTQHTYRYKVGDTVESSRLDRWYISNDLMEWVNSVNAVDLGGPSDHAAVHLALRNPVHRAGVKSTPKLYPPRPCAKAAVEAAIRNSIGEATTTFAALEETNASDERYLEEWDSFKTQTARAIKSAAAAALATVNRSYKTKVARLRRRMRSPDTTPADHASLSRQLQLTVDQWHALKRRRRLQQQAATGPAATRRFFARAAAPRAATIIQHLQPTPGAPWRTPSDVCNRMADGWTEIFSQPERAETPAAYVSPPGVRLTEDRADTMTAPFTLQEIERSLKRCHRSKSAGPDQLPNALYRDYAVEFAPLLAILFRRCLNCGALPASFGTATIVCIPKAGHSTDPLGYRPIALLNTDYKVFMRIWASRVKPLLQDIIAPSQAGFVPGRSIHDTIDLFHGAQRFATQHHLDTIAVLLDIQKAYDSLDRDYLDRCLAARGFPAIFRQAVQAAHATTTGRFRVNGFLSHPVPMTRGIRQGCPLAPLLFIIAMDPLYRQLATEADIGFPLGPSGPDLPTCAGYADDTAIYIRHDDALTKVEEQLHHFAQASGLVTNRQKSIVIRLNPRASPIPSTCGFASLPPDGMCRYLGAQVGNKVSSAAVWSLTESQIQRRLAMASLKTHTARQRATLVSAIAVPKILHVARHHWPPTAWVQRVDKCIRNFVWSAHYSQALDRGSRSQHWMTHPLACLPAKDGGLGLPNIELQLHAMAATTVARWGYEPTGIRQITASLLCNEAAYIQPRLYLTASGRRPRLGTDVWSTGRTALEWLYSSTLEYPVQVLIQDGIRALLLDKRWRWWRGEYERDYSDFYRVGGKEIATLRSSSSGKLSPGWIRHLAITSTHSAILCVDGNLLTSKHLSNLGVGYYVSDYVDWHWISPGVLRFRPKHAFPMSNAAAATFRTLCDTLVANFPNMIDRPAEPDSVATYNIPADMDVAWHLDVQAGLRQVTEGIPSTPVHIHNQHQLQRRLPIKTPSGWIIPSFECTPRLTSLVQVWRGDQPWYPHRRKYLRALGAQQLRRGLEERKKRDERWHTSNADIAAVLAQVDWDELAREPDITPTDAQLWHRIRLHQANSWKQPRAEPGDRHHECAGVNAGSTAHVFWECQAARRLWRKLTTLWGAQHQSDGEIRRAVFTKTAPESLFNWATQRTARTATETDRLLSWLQRAWTLLVMCACTRLRLCSIEENPRDDPDADYYVVVHQWRLRMLSLGATAPKNCDSDPQADIFISRMLLSMATREAPPTRIVIQQTRYLLFFDGGSRGNPGPGGCGAIIVAIDSTPEIVWAASVSLAAPTTTNNYAEYQGLCHGLTAAERHMWFPLEVIGDSQLIIRQMRGRHRPKAARLRPLYERARSTADRLNIRHWHHHFRRHNKMADKAANQAMDTRTSYHAEAAFGRPELSEPRVWLDNDFQQWAATAEPGTQVHERQSHPRPPAEGQGRFSRPRKPPEV